MTTTISNGSIAQRGPVVAERASRSLWTDARRRLLRNKAAVASLVYIGFLALVALFAPLLAPHNPVDIIPNNSYRHAAWVQIPERPEVSGSWEYVLGTDTNGRDVLSRLIFGTRTSLIVGFIPMFMTLFIGTTVGLIAGYRGGIVDNLLMRFGEIIDSFPAFLFFIIVMAALSDTPIGRIWNGFLVLFAALSIVGWVGVSRLVRGQVFSLKEKEFVEAARAVGVRERTILFRHLLPNTLGPIITTGAFIVPGAIITEAVLSYLGIGIRPATDSNAPFPVSWGNMILDGRAAINAQPWLLIAPALAIALITLAFTFLGDGLRDALDPRDQ